MRWLLGLLVVCCTSLAAQGAEITRPSPYTVLRLASGVIVQTNDFILENQSVTDSNYPYTVFSQKKSGGKGLLNISRQNRTSGTNDPSSASLILNMTSLGVLYVTPQASFATDVQIGGGLTVLSGTASTVPYFDANQVLTSSAVNPTELGRLSGVTSPIQTQFNALAVSSNARLIEITTGQAYEVTVVATRDAYFNATSATVKWPDGSAGTYTVTAHNSTFPQFVDAYTVTHTTSGKTVTQSAVTRDSNGNISTKPALTVAP